jgi:hypothetical protein
MKRPVAKIILAFTAATALIGIARSAEPTTESMVLGQALVGIEAPGVTQVLWIRRQDYYTLQVQFVMPPRGPNPPMVAAAPSGNPYPDVRVQLRDSSGAQIPHLRRLAVGNLAQAVARGAADNARRSEVIYTFHLGDGDSADTIRLQINDREFVGKLPRLN